MPNEYTIQTVDDFVKQYDEKHKKPLQTSGMVARTPRQYAEKHGMHINTVLAMLKGGGIQNSEKVGSRWKIYETGDNFISPEEYQKLKEENIRLQTLLDGINRMSQWKEQ